MISGLIASAKECFLVFGHAETIQKYWYSRSIVLLYQQQYHKRYLPLSSRGSEKEGFDDDGR